MLANSKSKKKTPLQRQKEKAKREARKLRLRARVEKRKAKRAAKAKPKNRLARWSKRVRAAGECCVCGATDNLQAHHLLPKERYQEYKFRTVNGVVLCPNHHKFGKFSAHRNMIWFSEWLRINRPGQFAWAVANMGVE